MAVTRKVRGPSRAATKTVSVPDPIKIPSGKVTPPKDLNEYVLFVMGQKGVGKSSLIGEFPGSLNIQLEPRRRNVAIRQVNVRPLTIAQMKSRSVAHNDTPWMQIKRVIHAAIRDASVKTLGIDTVDAAYEAAFNHHCYLAGVENPSDRKDYGKSWDVLKADFCETLDEILFAHSDVGRAVGLILTSHVRRAFDEKDTDDENLFEAGLSVIPTCKPACWNILKAVCDFCFYYGYVGRNRVMLLRGSENIWVSCGTADHFLTPDKKPVEMIAMGDSSRQAWKNLDASFNNKMKPYSG